MIQNCTFDLSKSELLESLTRSIREEFRYGHSLPLGEALEIQETTQGVRVIWGERPEVNDDVPFEKAPIVPPPVPASPCTTTEADF